MVTAEDVWFVAEQPALNTHVTCPTCLSCVLQADLATIRREAWVQLAGQLDLPLPHGILHHPELQVCVQQHSIGQRSKGLRSRGAATAHCAALYSTARYLSKHRTALQ